MAFVNKFLRTIIPILTSKTFNPYLIKSYRYIFGYKNKATRKTTNWFIKYYFCI